MKNHAFFCDIRKMTSQVMEVLTVHEEFSRILVPIVSYESARPVTYEEMKESCDEVYKAILEVHLPIDLSGVIHPLVLTILYL